MSWISWFLNFFIVLKILEIILKYRGIRIILDFLNLEFVCIDSCFFKLYLILFLGIVFINIFCFDVKIVKIEVYF